MRTYKQVFRRLNLATHPQSLRPDEYTYLKNAVPVQSPGGEDLTITSVLGNSELANADLPATGTNTIVGRWEDTLNNRVFILVHTSLAGDNTLYRINSDGTFTRVMRSTVLDLALGRFYDMCGIGDLVFWTDNVTEIKKIDTAKAIAGGTYTPTTFQITLIKPPPTLPLTWAMAYDDNTENNFLFGNYFQFFYRYIYENYDYSVFSPVSKITNSWGLPPDTSVRLASTQGNIALTGVIEVDGEDTSTGDRVLVAAQNDPDENGIYVAADGGAWSRAADFPAGGAVDLTVFVTGGLFFNFKSVWRLASTNPGTDPTHPRRIEGPNFATITRPVVPTATVIGVEYAARVNGANELIVYRKEQVGSFSSSHSFYNNTYLFSVPDAEAFRWHDSVPKRARSMGIFKNRLFTLGNTEGYTHNPTQQVALALVAINTSPTHLLQTDKTYHAAKPGGRYNVGIVFKETNGRIISNVTCVNSIDIPDKFSVFHHYRIEVTTDGIPGAVPAEATHFSIVSTKSLRESFFVSQWTQDIYHYKTDSAGVRTYSKTLTGFAAEGTAIDIGCLTKVKRGYTFNQGDRIKLYDIHFNDGTTEYSTIIDVEILGQDGRFVLTRVLNDLRFGSATDTNIPFEIYTPITSRVELYSETGHTYAIAEFANGPFTLEGDVEMTHEMGYRDTAAVAYNTTDPFANSYEAKTDSLVLVRKMNLWDQNSEKWIVPQSGRSTIVSEAREIAKSNYVRFGQQYIVNASILGLNTFFSADEYPLDMNAGPGTKLYGANSVLVAVCQLKTVALYIGDAFVKTSDASQFLAKTDNVIGDDREYFKDLGTLHPESVGSDDDGGRLYYFDMTKGVIVRRSNDGLTPISDLYGIGNWIQEFSRANFANRSTMRFPGGYDPVYKLYLLSAIDAGGTVLWTIGFHEADQYSETPYWVGFFDYLPLMYGKQSGYLLSFNGGKVWKHSNATLMNFYGVQKTRSLEFTMALLGTTVNLLEAISMDTDDFWTDSGANDEVVRISNNGAGVIRSGSGTQLTRINYLDLKNLQGPYQSAIYRDINTPQPFDPGKAKYEGEKMRGQIFKFTLYANKTNDEARLRSVTVLYTPSPRSYP